MKGRLIGPNQPDTGIVDIRQVEEVSVGPFSRAVISGYDPKEDKVKAIYSQKSPFRGGNIAREYFPDPTAMIGMSQLEQDLASVDRLRTFKNGLYAFTGGVLTVGVLGILGIL